EALRGSDAEFTARSSSLYSMRPARYSFPACGKESAQNFAHLRNGSREIRAASLADTAKSTSRTCKWLIPEALPFAILAHMCSAHEGASCPRTSRSRRATGPPIPACGDMATNSRKSLIAQDLRG